LAASEAAIRNLVPGKKLSEVYAAARQAVDEKWRDQFPPTIGYGIGSQVKEDGLNISAANEQEVQAGNVFHLRIGMNSLEGPANRKTVLLGDTLEVTPDGAKNRTAGIHRKYGQVSYSLGPEEEEKKPESKP